jgi:hypothetical protein
MDLRQMLVERLGKRPITERFEAIIQTASKQQIDRSLVALTDGNGSGVSLQGASSSRGR